MSVNRTSLVISNAQKTAFQTAVDNLVAAIVDFQVVGLVFERRFADFDIERRRFHTIILSLDCL